VLVGSRKVAGFALRRFKHSWLIQGSLLVRPLPDAVGAMLPRAVKDVLGARAIALSDAIGAYSSLSLATRQTRGPAGGGALRVGAPVSEEEVAVQWARQWPAWWDERLLAGGHPTTCAAPSETAPERTSREGSRRSRLNLIADRRDAQVVG